MTKPLDEMASDVASKIAYTSSGAGLVIGGLSINEWAAVAAIVVGGLTLLVNVYFKWRQDQRLERLAGERLVGRRRGDVPDALEAIEALAKAGDDN